MNLYGQRLVARTKTNENDNDHFAPQAARKTLSLPSRTDELDEDHYRDVRQPTTDRLQCKMDTEPIFPKITSNLGDNMKRKTSSNSLTASPSLPKKKDSKADEDGHRSFIDDLISKYIGASDASEDVSTLESKHSTGSDLFNENRSGDGFMDGTSITSSEASSLRNEAEPLSSSDFHTSDDSPAGTEDNLRRSSSSASRHEARMNFFTNYEEYLNQISTPPASLPGEDVNSYSKFPSPSLDKSSSVLPVSTSTSTSSSALEVNNSSDSSPRPPSRDNRPFFTPSTAAVDERKENSSKFSRSSERLSRRSDRRGSNSKHEGLSSRSGFSRSSKKRDHTATSDPGNRSSQGFVSYVSRVVSEIIESERTYIASLEDIIHVSIICSNCIRQR